MKEIFKKQKNACAYEIHYGIMVPVMVTALLYGSPDGDIQGERLFQPNVNEKKQCEHD